MLICPVSFLHSYCVINNKVFYYLEIGLAHNQYLMLTVELFYTSVLVSWLVRFIGSI